MRRKERLDKETSEKTERVGQDKLRSRKAEIKRGRGDEK